MMEEDLILEEQTESLSARRAWIEMRVNEDRYGQQFVALRKESVDRNMGI